MGQRQLNKIRRFSPIQRLFHVSLMVAFVVQAATGLGRMFIETGFGKGLTAIFGGYAGALTVHKIVGVIMLVLFGLHLLYVLGRVQWKKLPGSLFSPDSIVPRPSDITQFFRHTLWIIGLAKAPRLDRWGYWEKFDYWAVFWGMVIIGGSGLILFNPLATSRLMPGWSLNLAFWIHRIEAVLAIGHVFIIHFFIAHLRRENFPMDTVMFEGGVDLDRARHERAAWVERLDDTGGTPSLLVAGASSGARLIYHVFGLGVVIICLYLLVGSLANVRGVTW